MMPDERSEQYREWCKREMESMLNMHPRTIPREPLYVSPEPMSWWKYVLRGLAMCAFAGVLLWSVLDDIKAAMVPVAKPEPVQERPAQDISGQIRTLERMIVEAQQLQADIKALDEQIRRGIRAETPR
jgi:hypothetical protein